MNGRERVLSTLNHTENGLSVDFGSTPVTGIHISVVAALRSHYGLAFQPVKVVEPYQMLGEVDDELKKIIGIDTEGVFGPKTMFGFRYADWKEWRTPWDQDVLVPGGFQVSEEAGAMVIYPEGDRSVPPSGRMPEGGFFFDSIKRQQPIDEEKLDPKDNTEEFVPMDEEDVEYYAREVQNAAATGRAVVAALPGAGLGDIALVQAPFLKNPRGIRDVEEWYISTITRQDYLHEIFEYQTDIALTNFDRLKKTTGDSIDVAMVCGTDFGTQASTFCSSETFEAIYAPYYKKMNDWIHANTKWKTFKHTCGAIEPLIPNLVKAGFDIVNPVQCSAAGMDPELLKNRHGEDIVFWGAGVDTQETLPFGTPDQVRKEVETRCEIFSPKGGFVFNTIHNIQARSPINNVVALIEAIKKVGDR